MPIVIEAEKPVVRVAPKIAITDVLNYVDARKQADKAPEFKGLSVVNMPELIDLLQFAKTREAIRAKWADTVSGEYHLPNDEDGVYLAAHGKHPFNNTKRLTTGRSNMTDYGFMPISGAEKKALLANAVPIGDLKKGFVAGNANVAINMKDKPNINKSGQLSYDQWMADDRVLAVCGSEDARAYLGKFLFKEEAKRSSVGSYHRINDVGFDKALGRLLWLDLVNYGIGGSASYGNNGRFVGEAKGEALSAPEAQSAPGKALVAPSLEQIMKINSQYVATVNIEALRKEISGLYK